MAYFQENELEETRRQKILNVSADETVNKSEDYVASDYDDGFDDPGDEEDEVLTEDEKKEIRKKHFLFFYNAGNLAAVVAGTLMILILLAFLLQMIGFVLNDADRNFTLFQTRF